jgi:hypothetical protein
MRAGTAVSRGGSAYAPASTAWRSSGRLLAENGRTRYSASYSDTQKLN